MRRAAILLLFALPAFAAEPSKFTLAQSGTAADPLTVLGPAAVCADQQIALWDGASATRLQCSVVTIADTTGQILAGNGSDAAPSYSFTSAPGIGMHWNGGTEVALDGGSIGLTINGAYYAILSSARNGFQLGSGHPLLWGTIGGTPDLGLARSAAGVVKVTDGDANLGKLRVGDAGAGLGTCDAAMAGAIAFDADEAEFCGCNGSAWAALDGAGTCD